MIRWRYTLLLFVLVGAAILGMALLWLAPLYLRALHLTDLGVTGSAALAWLLGRLWLQGLRARWAADFPASVTWAVALATFATWLAAVLGMRAWLPVIVPADSSLPVIYTAAAAGTVLLLLTSLVRSRPVTLSLLALCVLGAGIMHLALRTSGLHRSPPARIGAQYIDSSLYRLQLITYANRLPFTQSSGGGIAPWADGMLVASGSGKLAVLRGLGQIKPLSVTELRYRIPVNTAEFMQDATAILSRLPAHYADVHRFRVADLLTVEHGADITIYASHHYWDLQRHCFVLRVSVLSGARAALESGALAAEWRTLFDTSPCLTLNTAGPRGLPFEGWENGGRLGLLNERELLLTVGDHGFDGVNRKPALAQQADNSYGKILRVPLDGSPASIYSIGHRNPQGLLIQSDGTVWETEHGPRGGDELNRIVAGANYGWPLESLGTDYGNRSWPLDSTPGRHDRFTGPVYAFIPSIGISNLIEAPAQSYPAWRGDLLVGSLVRQTLYRLRLHDGAVQFAEPMQIGNRIRDLAVTRDGTLVLWSDDGSIAALRPSDESAAERLISVCAGCHTTTVTQPSFGGPSLYGVVNRRVASLSDFNYSPAMQAFGGRWTRERLDSFLADPQRVVPGTTMNFPGMPSRADRQAIIDFLQDRPQD